MTGWTNTEECAGGLTKVEPFPVGDMLRENGGIDSKRADREAYVLRGGVLIKGQNLVSLEAAT